jgi:hypothetical protein
MISTRIVLCSARGILARARRPGGARDAWSTPTRRLAIARARELAARPPPRQRGSDRAVSKEQHRLRRHHRCLAAVRQRLSSFS